MNKYYIKQYVINNYSFQDWKTNFENDEPNSVIVGYLFHTKSNKFGVNTSLLNLYLVNKKYYHQEGIRDEVIQQDWELFFTTYERRWHNPPLEIWLNTKDNWCKKLANKLSTKFNRTYEDALSDVYYAIIKCYNKKTIYMGSLDYISRSVTTDILMSLRKSRFYVGEISSNEVLGTDKDGNELTIEDTLQDENDDCGQKDLEYQDVYKRCVDLMQQNFSDREIEQIITHPFKLLDRNVYQRLLKFRNKHSVEEVLEK